MPAKRTRSALDLPAFLNVDLEILSKVKLAPLATEWGEKVFVLYSGRGCFEPGPASLKSRRYLLTLEASPGHKKSPDHIIHTFCTLVEGLSPANRLLWDQAQKRFDVGYELRPTDQWTHFVLRTDTLARLTALGAALAVSVYDRERMNKTGDAAAAPAAPTTASPTPTPQNSGSPRPSSA